MAHNSKQSIGSSTGQVRQVRFDCSSNDATNAKVLLPSAHLTVLTSSSASFGAFLRNPIPSGFLLVGAKQVPPFQTS